MVSKTEQYARSRNDTIRMVSNYAGLGVKKKSSYSILNEEANFGLWAPYNNTDAAKNHSIELTVEHFLNNGFYFLGFVMVHSTE
ncbi:MAG: hypothetical protein HXX16_18050 [Bacteroidales bacterium]|nr:hypothetical protein [Bacteroidales bacterium]